MDFCDDDEINCLIEKIIEAYQQCKQDRHRLHEIEWASGDESFGILGEAEVRCGDVVGLATSFIANDQDRPVKAEEISRLCKYSAYRMSTLQEWMVKHGQEFPAFARYLQTVELLIWEVAERMTDRTDTIE